MKGNWQDPRRLSREELDTSYRSIADAIERRSSPPNSYQEHLVGIYLAEISRRDSNRFSLTILRLSIAAVMVSAAGVCATVLAIFFR